MPSAFLLAGQSDKIRSDFATAFTGDAAMENGMFLSEPGGAPTLEDHEQTTFELTYNGQFMDGKVEYTGGLFYFDEETGNGQTVPRNDKDASNYLFVLGQFAHQVTADNIKNYLVPVLQGGDQREHVAAGERDAVRTREEILLTLGPISSAAALLGTIKAFNAASQDTSVPLGLLRQLVGDGSAPAC